MIKRLQYGGSPPLQARGLRRHIIQELLQHALLSAIGKVCSSVVKQVTASQHIIIEYR